MYAPTYTRIAQSGSTTEPPGAHRRIHDTEPPLTDTASLYWFAALEAAGIRYALLRGYDAASALRPGADVDLLVHPDDLAGLQECLEVACEHSGARIVQTFSTPHARQYMLHGRTKAGSHSLLSFDVHTAEACFGMPYLAAPQLLTRSSLRPATRFRWEHSGDAPLVPCIDLAWAGLIRFQNNFLSSGSVTGDLIAFFAHATQEVQSAMQLELRRWYGANMGQRIVWALREGDPLRLQALAKPARRRLWWRSLRYHPWQSVLGTLRTASALRMRPYLKPRGLCIAFLGTDGSGKTTLIEAVQRVLQPHYRDGQSGVRKLRPGLLPQINRLVHWRKLSYSAEDCTAPHRAQPSGAIGSALRASWYALDCILGWPLRILPLRRRNVLLIFDRYSLEFLVDPRRARIHPNSSFPRWWSRWVPKPDATLVCVAEPEVILRRKQELEPCEVERQVRGYEKLAQSEPKMHLIPTGGSLEESLDRVLSSIYAPLVP